MGFRVKECPKETPKIFEGRILKDTSSILAYQQVKANYIIYNKAKNTERNGEKRQKSNIDSDQVARKNRPRHIFLPKFNPATQLNASGELLKGVQKLKYFTFIKRSYQLPSKSNCSVVPMTQLQSSNSKESDSETQWKQKVSYAANLSSISSQVSY